MSGAPAEDQRLLSDEEVRSIQLQTLSTFAQHCEERGLRYFLAYGTLLGAVRHSGYIPWDDDIDVMMPRADYELVRCNREIGSLRVGGCVGDAEWPYANLKVGDSSTVVKNDGPFDSGIGVNIDVFPLDHVPTGARRVVQRQLLKMTNALLILQSVSDRPDRGRMRDSILRTARPVAALLPRWRLLKMFDRLAAMTQRDRGLCGVLTGSYQWVVPSEAVDSAARLEFEGMDVAVPNDVDVVLTAMYGRDFLTPPPPSQRVRHHTFTAHRL